MLRVFVVVVVVIIVVVIPKKIKSTPSPRPKSGIRKQFKCGFELLGRCAKVAGEMCKSCWGDVQRSKSKVNS